MRVYHRNRGNALVLSVLILMALTSVGIIGVQRTNTDVLVAGNVARANQAALTAEAGVVHGMARIGGAPNVYMNTLQKDNEDNSSTSRGVDVGDFSSAIPDPSGTGANFFIPTIDVEAGDQKQATMLQAVAYSVDAMWLKEIKGAPGSDVDSEMCHELFDVNAQGGIPTSSSQLVADTMAQSDTIVVRMRARAQAGIVKCKLAH